MGWLQINIHQIYLYKRVDYFASKITNFKVETKVEPVVCIELPIRSSLPVSIYLKISFKILNESNFILNDHFNQSGIIQYYLPAPVNFDQLCKRTYILFFIIKFDFFLFSKFIKLKIWSKIPYYGLVWCWLLMLFFVSLHHNMK